jgi:MFS family permease
MATRRNLYGLDGVNFFIAAVQTGFGAFVTVYLVNQQWSAQAIGFVLTIGTLSSLFSQMPAGAFIDSLPDKSRAVRLGIIGIGGAALLLGLSSARPIVGLALVLQGLASSLIGPGIASISLAVVGRAAFGEQVGRNARFASIGNGLTAAVMGAAGSWFAPATIFLVSAVLTVPALLSLRLIGARHGRTPATSPGRDDVEAGKLTWRGVKELFSDRRLLVFAACVVLFFASSAALLPAIAGQVTRRRPEFATLIVAATILLPQIIVALIAPWIGRTAERAGRRPMLLLGWGLLPVQGLLYAAWPGPYAVVTGQILNGMSSAVFGCCHRCHQHSEGTVQDAGQPFSFMAAAAENRRTVLTPPNIVQTFSAQRIDKQCVDPQNPRIREDGLAAEEAFAEQAALGNRGSDERAHRHCNRVADPQQCNGSLARAVGCFDRVDAAAIGIDDIEAVRSI